jgi:hypothetical protein
VHTLISGYSRRDADNADAAPVPIQDEWSASGSVKTAGTKGGYRRLEEPLLASSSSAFNDSDSDN